MINGFVAGFAGTGLNDDLALQSSVTEKKTSRTVRLSANSTSFEVKFQCKPFCLKKFQPARK